MGSGASTMRNVDAPEGTPVAPPTQPGFATSTWSATLSVRAETGMDTLLADMGTPAHEITVVFNTEPLRAPYVNNSALAENPQVAFGTHTALYTGIGKLVKLGEQDFLVSDSFRPCVPVVVFHGNGTWLAHSMGIGAVQHLMNHPELKDGQVVVISKALDARQSFNAVQVGWRLVAEGFDVRIVDIPTAATIAVIVGPLSKRILAYFETAI